MAVLVAKVTIRGPQFIGRERQTNLKGLVGADIYTRSGRITTARLNDFSGVELKPNLNPGAFQQTFVTGPVVERAEALLDRDNYAEIAERAVSFAGSEIDFSHLTFGLNASDVMFMAKIDRGGYWSATPISQAIFPFEDILINPAAQVLHYGQAGFEGCKAYRSEKGNIVSFRLEENARRHARTSARLALTPVPEGYYLDAVRATVLANDRLLAPPGLGAAMYIRPFHFGSGPQLGVAPAPSETFMIFVSPVGPYFKGGMKAQSMWVEEEFRRSAPGLMGSVKVAGNYAGSLVPGVSAKGRGFAEAIYLDVLTGKNIEEVGAANAFFVIDEVLHTPALSGTILPGITRDSIITLARDMGMVVVDDQPVPLKLAMAADEAFCTGTAAVVTPVGSITRGNGERVEFNQGKLGPITKRLYDALVGIQEERIPDPYGWVYRLG